MHAVADLMTLCAETNVLERTPGGPGMNPIAENALVGFAKLPGSGEHTAAVDAHGELKG